MTIKDDGTEYCDCCGAKFDEASAAEDADICPSCARELWPEDYPHMSGGGHS